MDIFLKFLSQVFYSVVWGPARNISRTGTEFYVADKNILAVTVLVKWRKRQSNQILK
jgi:hypothetical protein